MEKYERNNLTSLEKKAKHIFNLCDQKGNGFITKNDLLKLNRDLPFSQEQLLNVFESLDTDSRGFVTYEEFVSAFRIVTVKNVKALKLEYEEYGDIDEDEEDDDDKKTEENQNTFLPYTANDFNKLFSSLSHCPMLKDLETKHLFQNGLNGKDKGDLLSSFEVLMSDIVGKVNKIQHEYHGLRETLEKQRQYYNEEMYHMCSEVEAKSLEHCTEKKEREKERRMNEKLIEELKEKDILLQELKQKQIALEEHQREISRKREEEVKIISKTSASTSTSCDQVDFKKDEYFDSIDLNDAVKETGNNVENNVEVFNDKEDGLTQPTETYELSEWMELERQHLLRYVSQLERKNKELLDVQGEIEDKILSPKKNAQLYVASFNPTSQLDYNTNRILKTTNAMAKKIRSRSYMFRVVFVGDSGVGKSTLMHRVCCGEFQTNLGATVGVDCQLASMQVGGCEMVLQMWDTAGQERFRSFCQQYFRKADAVVAAYNICKPASFINLRAWLHHIQSSIDKDTFLMVVGTKLDLLDYDVTPFVPTNMARKLASEFDASFFETSALDGSNVEEAFMYLAQTLKEKQEKAIETSITQRSKGIKLQDSNKISFNCCL